MYAWIPRAARSSQRAFRVSADYTTRLARVARYK
jgi:hypothetical protein